MAMMVKNTSLEALGKAYMGSNSCRLLALADFLKWPGIYKTTGSNNSLLSPTSISLFSINN